MSSSLRNATLLVLLLTSASLLLVSNGREGDPEPRYLDTIPVFWGELYPAGGETLYCGEAFGPRKGRHINIEHVLPMSWAMKQLGCAEREQCRRDSSEFNRIESDLHNLYPARRDINKERGSMPYGMVPGEERRFGRCDFEIDERRRRVEPRPAVRGEIARAMFYMHDRYRIPIHAPLGKLLKEWNREDPPRSEERGRNDIIERLQGRRNRFIDDPGAAASLRF